MVFIPQVCWMYLWSRDYILMELSECQQGHFTDVLLCQGRKAEVSATLRNTEMTDIL